MGILAVGSLSSESRADELVFEGVRINQAQVIGTHNSYHIAPHPSLDALIRSTSEASADEVMYSHRPLSEQFERLGIRQIELDLFADGEGGRFSNPRGPAVAIERGLAPVPEFDPEGVLDQPGLKILHFPDVDYLTTVFTFREALEEIKTWSDANPDHFPITVLLELKAGPALPGFTQTEPFTSGRLAEIDATIREMMEPEDLLTPAQVRGDYSNLREAILERGWPSVVSAWGRVMFCLDNTNEMRDDYLALDPEQHRSVLFLSVEPDHPAAGWFKMNNPIREFEEIQRRVRQGFMVRTRADSPISQARENDGVMRDRALSSGAQLISTDYPEPNLSFSRYRVAFPNGEVARVNPVSGDMRFSGIDLE